MDPGFRKRTVAATGALIFLCLLSAVTAITALSFTNRTSEALRRAGDDSAAVDALRLQLSGLAHSGERVQLANNGPVRLRELEGEVDRARDRLRARAIGTYFARDVEVLDRDAHDLTLAVGHAAKALTGDPRGALVAYRDALKPVRDAFDADAISLTRKLVAHRDHFSSRTTRVAAWAQFVLAVTAAVAIVMSIVVAANAMRTLGRQHQRARSALEDAKRTAASRHELLAASKDLRTPIELILRVSSEWKRTPNERLADEVHAAAERLHELVNALLDVSGIEAGTVDLRREGCDTSALIDAAVKSVQLVAAKQSIRVLVVVPAPILVHVDRQRMIQVLATLIGMSIRSTHRGGGLTITAQPFAQGTRFAIDTSTSGFSAQLTNLCNESPGSAVGLSMEFYISKRLVEAHGGQLGVEGNTLWFSLPSEPLMLREPSQAEKSPARVPRVARVQPNLDVR